MKKFEKAIDTSDPEAWKSDEPVVVDVNVAGITQFQEIEFLYKVFTDHARKDLTLPPGLYALTLTKLK